MEMARIRYSRELKISAMRALEAGETSGQVARKFEISPKLLEKWRAEWRARGEAAFPGAGRRPRLEISSSEQQRIAELERKIGQMAIENDFLKKPCSISRSITLRPSSVANMLVRPARRMPNQIKPAADEGVISAAISPPVRSAQTASQNGL
jgi:transposase-like protein